MQKHVLAKFKTQPQYNEPTTGFSNFFENASIHIKNTQTGNFPVTGKSGQKTTKMKNLLLWLPDILMNCLLHFLQDKVWVLGITEQTDATKSFTISKTNKVCRVVVVTEIAYFSKKCKTWYFHCSGARKRLLEYVCQSYHTISTKPLQPCL